MLLSASVEPRQHLALLYDGRCRLAKRDETHDRSASRKYVYVDVLPLRRAFSQRRHLAYAGIPPARGELPRER